MSLSNIPARAALLESPATQAWLSQFAVGDQELAGKLVEAIRVVSRSEFARELKALIRRTYGDSSGRVALYAEREIPRRLGVPHRLFKESSKKVKRAFGAGPLPVKPVPIYSGEVGSEGPVAQLITEICRSNRQKYLNHPGPEQIRRKHVRHFVVVTDLVGSGGHARKYLDAAWRVRSVRSWASLHLMTFDVLAFAATKKGGDNVRQHSCAPRLLYVLPCPTIQSEFRGVEKRKIRTLCRQYDPVLRRKEESFGYGGSGALLVFAHGAPNNVPRMLFETSKTWKPLFPRRVAGDIVDTDNLETPISFAGVRRQLLRMRFATLVKGTWLEALAEESRLRFLVLLALGKWPRTDEALAYRTRLTMVEVPRICNELEHYGWIDGNRRLTDAGQSELRFAQKDARRKSAVESSEVAKREKAPYYPKSLRPPKKESSGNRTSM